MRLFRRKSFAIVNEYHRRVDSYRSTVAATARKIALRMARRHINDRVGIQSDIALLERQLLWLGEHHLPRAYRLGHGRRRDDPREAATLARVLARHRARVLDKFIPAVRVMAVKAMPSTADIDDLIEWLADEDPADIARELAKLPPDDATAEAIRELLEELEDIDDPAERAQAARSNITLGIILPGIAVTFAAWASTLGGEYWATIWEGKRDKVEFESDGAPMPVKRTLEPGAQHCDTCPPKAREYDSWEDMLSACGGLPGDGSDDCHSNCRCELWEWDGETWVQT